jgi:predicted outer membrane repeat protein
LRRRSIRLLCEQLEDRTVPSSFTAATVPELIADISAANLAGGYNTIALVAGNTLTLTVGGLPVIAANDNLTIQGNGDTLARSTASGTPYFRLFDVAPGASLTLANVTLQGGYAYGGCGGAILNQGAVDLKGVTVQNNGASSGGGIYSSGSLTLEAGTLISGNQAVGTNGYVIEYPDGSSYVVPAGDAYGGGVYVAGGTATLANTTLSSNSAQGGFGSGIPRINDFAGNAYGGGLYVAAGTVTLTSDTLKSNSAVGGSGNNSFPGSAFGGALYAAGGTVTLRYDTVMSNSSQGGISTTANKQKWEGGRAVAVCTSMPRPPCTSTPSR